MARKATNQFCCRTVDFRSADSFCSAWLYLPAPDGDVRLYHAGHFDFYLGEAFEKLVADQTEFLVSHLQPAPAPSGPSEQTVTEG